MRFVFHQTAFVFLAVLTYWGYHFSSHPSVSNRKPADIGNGIETSDFTPVVELRFRDPNENFSNLCTGTYISAVKILTAAHCLCGNEDKKLLVNGKEKMGTRYRIHRKYECNERSIQNDQHDLGLILLTPSENNEPIETYSIQKIRPNPGDEIMLVGFGNGFEFTVATAEWGKGAGTKRLGRNTIDSFDHEMIVYSGRRGPELEWHWIESVGPGLLPEATGIDVTGLSGDSGGPILDQSFNIVGIMVTHDTIFFGMNGEHYAVLVSEKSNYDFIQNTR